MKTIFFSIFINLFVVINLSFAQNISGKVKINTYTFFYQVTLKSGGMYDFTVKTHPLTGNEQGMCFIFAFPKLYDLPASRGRDILGQHP